MPPDTERVHCKDESPDRTNEDITISLGFLLLLRYYVIFEHDYQHDDQLFYFSAFTSFLTRFMNVRAYAKINIGLRILGKRSDGYHDIETIFHQIDLYDELLFEPAETVELTTTSPDVPGDSTNLCIRAAQLFREHTGHREGVAIRLTKCIPVGAGLGGGSSNAAAVLLALNKLWHVGMKTAELQSLAANLGSDVPFFIQGGSAAGTSRGEILDHFHLQIPYWILTVTPPIHISTAWAYANVRADNVTGGMVRLRTIVEENLASAPNMQAYIKNDFEGLVYRTYPEIHHLKEGLEKAGALFTQLSGSGSTVFGFFQERTGAQSVARKFPSTFVTSLTTQNFKPMRIS